MHAPAAPSSTPSLAGRLKAEALRLGFDDAGITRLRPSDHSALYRSWLAEGRHGDMHYLARPDALERRLDLRRSAPALRSALVVAQNYYVPDDGEEDDLSRGIIARYARGRDYHKVIKQNLLRLLAWTERDIGRELPVARAYVDTGPVLERELARRAGLGWFGRNTMLLHPRRGSYFFLGVLLLELELDEDAPFEKDHCGTCNACVSACPTGALLGRTAEGAPIMDARRCISYLTIENRGTIPRELRPLIGNRIFGCDICQEVCPWNGRFSTPTRDPAFAARGPAEPPQGRGRLESSARHPGTDAPSLIELLETALDDAAWDCFSRGSALRRAGRPGFARNVCVALGNRASPDAVDVLSAALEDVAPLVRAHAAWALGRIDSPEAGPALSMRLSIEPEESVAAEIILALDASRSRAKKFRPWGERVQPGPRAARGAGRAPRDAWL